MKISQKIKLRWYAWLIVAFAIVWFFFGLFASIGVALSLFVGERLYRTWKTKREFEGAGAKLMERMDERLIMMFDHPSERYVEFLEVLKGGTTNTYENYRKNLRSQIESARNLAYVIHVSNPDEWTLMKGCRTFALGVSGMKLVRAIDISSALEVKQSANWDEDRDYLLEVIKKNAGEDGTPTGMIDPESYQSNSGSVIAIRLAGQVKQYTFEAEMWAYVAYYSGDNNALKWVEEAAPKLSPDSVEYWQKFLATQETHSH